MEKKTEVTIFSQPRGNAPTGESSCAILVNNLEVPNMRTSLFIRSLHLQITDIVIDFDSANNKIHIFTDPDIARIDFNPFFGNLWLLSHQAISQYVKPYSLIDTKPSQTIWKEGDKQ